MPDPNGETRIPNWFLWLCGFLILAGVPWAWKLQADVSAIKAEIGGSYRLIDSKFGDVDRRLNSHDRRLERLEGQ